MVRRSAIEVTVCVPLPVKLYPLCHQDSDALQLFVRDLSIEARTQNSSWRTGLCRRLRIPKIGRILNGTVNRLRFLATATVLVVAQDVNLTGAESRSTGAFNRLMLEVPR